jgi:hypothetical protein
LDVSRFKRTPQSSYSRDIAPSDFFFSVGWKSSLNGENIIGKMNYMKSWIRFWQLSRSKWSKRSLSTGWIDSSTCLREIMTTFPEISQVSFWTEGNNAKHVRIEH